MKIDTHELAWAAGFFDGEGHAGYNQRTHKPRLAVTQTDRRVLDRFQTAVLGVGKVHGPLDRGNPKHALRWDWMARSFEDVQAVVAVLFKFLSPVKQAQCKQVLVDYAAHGQRRQRRAAGTVYWKKVV